MSVVNPSVELKQAIAALDTLPAMPAIAQKLLMLSLDTDEGEAAFLKLIEQDPQISAKIVGLANAPLYGASRRILSVQDAVMVMGLLRVRSVVLGIAAMSALKNQEEGRLKSKEVWMHSMSIAVAMSAIARSMPATIRPHDDHIFFAGLLHDIGYMALSYVDTQASDKLHEQLQQVSGGMALKIEKALLGMTHADIGAQLAQHWHLPEEIVAVIRDHHHPTTTDTAEHLTLVRLVSLAEKMLGEFGVLKQTEQIITDCEWQVLGIDPEKSDDIRNQVCEIATQAGQMAAAF